MKTQNKKLVFRKNAIINLNNDELLTVNGGSTPVCAGAAASSAGCAAGAAAVGAAVGVAIAVIVDKIKN